MEILKDRYNNPIEIDTKTYDVMCEHCNSEIRVADNDLVAVVYGGLTFSCPCCKKVSDVEWLEDRLTWNQVAYPINWYINEWVLTDSQILDNSTMYFKDAITTLYNNLKNIEIPVGSDKEVYDTYCTGHGKLILTKHRNAHDIYEYELQLVKELASTVFYDNYERVSYNEL